MGIKNPFWAQYHQVSIEDRILQPNLPIQQGMPAISIKKLNLSYGMKVGRTMLSKHFDILNY